MGGPDTGDRWPGAPFVQRGALGQAPRQVARMQPAAPTSPPGHDRRDANVTCPPSKRLNAPGARREPRTRRAAAHRRKPLADDELEAVAPGAALAHHHVHAAHHGRHLLYVSQ